MKKIITGIIVLYAPIGLCLNSSLLQDNLYRINIATLEGEEVPPVSSEDREGEDDPGILKDAQISADQGFDKAKSAKKDLEKNLSKSEKEEAMKMYRHYTGAQH